MTRYPFRHAVNDYLRVHKGLFAPSTYKERMRRFGRMARDIEGLWRDGSISTTDPSRMTSDDVKTFYLMLKDRDLSPKGLSHELSALNSLLVFTGNNAVSTCRQRFPLMRARAPSFRLPTTPYPVLHRIIDAGGRCTGYANLRNYAVVVCSYCAGMRTVEIQHAKAENLDLADGVIYVDVVKGQGTYGEPRYIPVHPSGLSILTAYTEVRNRMHGPGGYLFPSPSGNPLSTNTLRSFKKAVAVEVSYDFDFREARRTFGQMLIDEGISVEDVAVIMGHRTSKTTETYYARRTQKSAITNVFNTWNKEKNEHGL